MLISWLVLHQKNDIKEGSANGNWNACKTKNHWSQELNLPLVASESAGPSDAEVHVLGDWVGQVELGLEILEGLWDLRQGCLQQEDQD